MSSKRAGIVARSRLAVRQVQCHRASEPAGLMAARTHPVFHRGHARVKSRCGGLTEEAGLTEALS